MITIGITLAKAVKEESYYIYRSHFNMIYPAVQQRSQTATLQIRIGASIFDVFHHTYLLKLLNTS